MYRPPVGESDDLLREILDQAKTCSEAGNQKTGLVDASSAILLYKSDILRALLEAYNILISESAYEEVTREDYPGASVFRRCRVAGELTVQPAPLGEVSATRLSAMHRGERDTIRCFEAGYGNFIITDDGKAARYCRKRRIPFVNAILVPRLLFLAGRLSQRECARKIEALVRLGRYGRHVVDFAKRCPSRDLVRFLP